jgi:hypothetical protein
MTMHFLTIFKALGLFSFLRPIAAGCWKPQSSKSERTFGGLSFERTRPKQGVVVKTKTRREMRDSNEIEVTERCSFGITDCESRDSENKEELSSRRSMLDDQREDYMRQIVMVSSWN